MKKVYHDPHFTGEKSEAPEASQLVTEFRLGLSGWVTSLLRTHVIVAPGAAVKSHRVWSLLLVLLSPCLSLAAQLSAQPGHPGFCQDGSGAELGGGSEEVTLEAALCPGISPWDPPKRQECGPSWLRVTWRAGQACVWHLINAQEEWALGGSFHCVSSSLAWGGGAPTVPPEKLVNLSLKGASLRALVGARW